MQKVSGDDWSANAKTYATVVQEEGPLHRPCNVLLERLNQISPIDEVIELLDVGCGPGTLISMMIQMYGSVIPGKARIISSDFSAGMIEQVEQRRNDESGNTLWQRVETKVLDARELAEIPNDSISHVTGNMVYCLVPDGEKAVQSAYRVLQPGGVIAMTNWASVEWLDLMELAARAIRGDAAARFKFPAGFASIGGLKGTLADAGFKGEHFEEVECFMDVSDPSKLIDGFLCSNNPGALLFTGDYTEDEKARFVKEYLRLLEERHRQLPRKLKGVAIVAIGRK